MAVHLFGAIDVGSYVYEMKIFELSRKNGIRQIDCIRHMMDIGTDTYHTGKISRVQSRGTQTDTVRIHEDHEELRGWNPTGPTVPVLSGR